MTASFMAWWRERSLREQRLLLVMAALLAITVLWLGIYRPIQAALSQGRERHQEAVVRLAEIRDRAEVLRGLSGTRSPALAGSLAEVVTRSANNAGFANAAVAPQGDRRVFVSVPAARPGPLLAWIASLEAQGIVVERFVARANTDPSLTVDATLMTGGS